MYNITYYLTGHVCFFARRFFASQPLRDRDELLQNTRVNTSSAFQLKSTGKLISFFHVEKVSLRFVLLDLEKKTSFIHQHYTLIIHVQQASYKMFAKLLKQSYMGHASIGCVCDYIVVIVVVIQICPDYSDAVDFAVGAGLVV